MKRRLTLLFAIALAGTAFAQVPRLDTPPTTSFTPLESDDPYYHESTDVIHSSDQQPEAAGDVIYSEDFGNGFPNSWTLLDSSGINPWKHSTVGSQGFFNGTSPIINSVSAANGFLISDPDSANDTNFGQPSGTTYQYLSSWFITEPIATFGYPQVRLQFSQFFRFNNDVNLVVQVSNVSATGPWQETYTVQGNNVNNTASANVDFVSIDLPASMGNQANIFVKIGWNARVYYWQIDDFQIVEAPDNDLLISQSYFGNYGDSTRTVWYTQVPERQADAFNVDFGAAIENLGTQTVTSSGLRVEAYADGNQFYAQQNTGGEVLNIGAGAIDSFNISVPMNPNQGVGDYEVVFVPISDSVDAFPDNDTLRSEFSVTDNEYARDNGIDRGGITWGAGNPASFALGQLFEFPTDDTVMALRVHWFDNATSGNGTDNGIPINVSVWDDQFNRIGGKDFHIIDTNETPLNDWGNIVFDVPVPVSAGQEYIIGFEKVVPTDAVWISTFDFELDDAPPLTVFVDVNLDGTWGFADDIPMLRALTKPESCASVSFTVNGTVDDASEIGAITINSITGGSGVYTYNWTGPNGYSATTQDITGLDTKGDYTLNITDENFCTGSQTFTVGGSVGLVDVSQPLPNIRVFPNPNDGTFSLLFQNANQDQYQLEVMDLVGKSVHRQQSNVTGTQQIDLQLDHLSAGIYNLTVMNSDREQASFKLVIR